MSEIISQIVVIDEQAKCKDRVFRETVLLYLAELPGSYIKNKILEYNRDYRNDKNFRIAVMRIVESGQRPNPRQTYA